MLEQHDDITQGILGENAIDRAVGYSTELVGKECIGCMKALPYSHFKSDASYRDGHRDLCNFCAAAPRLSTQEHTYRLREMTSTSEAVKRQRWANQEDYKNAVARIGRPLPHSDFLVVLQKLIPTLYVTDGRIQGDLALFRTYGQPQPQLDGRTFEYIGYCPTGIIPEFSIYEFDEVRDILVREQKRGWRTVLLRLIRAGLVTEEICNTVFGRPEGPASTVWHRTLHNWRNQRLTGE